MVIRKNRTEINNIFIKWISPLWNLHIDFLKAEIIDSKSSNTREKKEKTVNCLKKKKQTLRGKGERSLTCTEYLSNTRHCS